MALRWILQYQQVAAVTPKHSTQGVMALIKFCLFSVESLILVEGDRTKYDSAGVCLAGCAGTITFSSIGWGLVVIGLFRLGCSGLTNFLFLRVALLLPSTLTKT